MVTICTTSLTFSNPTFCPHSCIYVFCVGLRTYSHYFPIQHKLTGLYNRYGVCLLRGTDWIFKYDLYYYASRAALTDINFKISTQTQPPPTLSKFRHNAALQTQNSAPKLVVFPRSILQQPIPQHLPLFTTQSFNLLPACLYHKDERALPGNLQNNSFSISFL